MKVSQHVLREVWNAVTMIPGITLGVKWLTSTHCGILFPSSYILFSLASMTHHLTSAFRSYDIRLLRVDLTTQQICSLMLLSNEREFMRMWIVMAMIYMSLLVNLHRKRRVAYAINGLTMMVVADHFGTQAKKICLGTILVFIYGNITRNKYAHGIFHILSHVTVWYLACK